MTVSGWSVGFPAETECTRAVTLLVPKLLSYNKVEGFAAVDTIHHVQATQNSDQLHLLK